MKLISDNFYELAENNKRRDHERSMAFWRRVTVFGSLLVLWKIVSVDSKRRREDDTIEWHISD